MQEQKIYTAEEIIKIGTEIGIQTAIDYIRKEKEDRRKGRFDRRLRNTKILLREYKKLVIHSNDAVFKNKNTPSAVEILDDIDSHEYTDELYIESIKASTERTRVIVEHIKKMMKIFKYLCYKTKKPETQRRYDIVYDMYISGKDATAEELSAKYSLQVSTIYRDMNIAIEGLTSLVFGIDGLKIF